MLGTACLQLGLAVPGANPTTGGGETAGRRCGALASLWSQCYSAVVSSRLLSSCHNWKVANVLSFVELPNSSGQCVCVW